MNTQEHIKNCKECGKGFYCQGFEICANCTARRYDVNSIKWSNSERQAMMARNFDPIQFNQIKMMQQKDDAMNQGVYGKDNREAQRSLNMIYSDLVEQAIANKPLASCRKESNRVMTKADLDKLSLRVHIYCAAIFAFILYMHIFKL